MHPEWKRNAVV